MITHLDGMMSFRILIVFLGWAFGANISVADTVCGPGMELGNMSSCQSSGGWCCVRAGTFTSPAGNNATAQVAAGFALIGIVSQLASQLTANDDLGPVERDPEGNGKKSVEANRAAFAAMQRGEFSKAEDLFVTAANYASRAGNYDESSKNNLNAKIASVQDLLARGLAAERKGNLSEASKMYGMARSKASLVKMRGDLRRRIEEGTRRVVGKAQSNSNQDSGQIVDETSFCNRINGRIVCN